MNLESKLPPMPTVTFLSANDVAKELLPGSDFDTANAFAVSHVSAAIENLAPTSDRLLERGTRCPATRTAPSSLA